MIVIKSMAYFYHFSLLTSSGSQTRR